MAEIGKNVIEHLTTGMYENSYTIYREYIQNAADSIDKAIQEGIIQKDEANIDILIENKKRRITIYDNAKGISKEEFYSKLSDIANSDKDYNTDKGFRGIGRLAGLAYCNKLIFTSSAMGQDVKSIMEWDGKKLLEILNDHTKHISASDLVEQLISYRQEKANKDEHFFEVILDGVYEESKDLLDEEKVRNYLEAVAPVPYVNSFSYKSEVYRFKEKENLQLDEYEINLNSRQLFKPYTMKLYVESNGKKEAYDEVNALEFRKFYNNDGKLIAWMWFAVTNFEKQIPVNNRMRGIRLRKENIQIGNEETLSYPRFFKEARGNYYFIGEVFAVDSNLIPNARRDYFNTNLSLREFEEKLQPVLHDELYHLYHYANQVKKSFQKTAEYTKSEADFNEKNMNGEFINDTDKEEAKQKLESKKNIAKDAERKLQLRKKDTETNNIYKKVYAELEKKYMPKSEKTESNNSVKETSNSKETKYLSQKLSKYGRKEQKLISRIYAIIKSILPSELAETIVTKIQEELSK